MQHLLALLIFLSYSHASWAQNLQYFNFLQLQVEDALGQKDTITLGTLHAATASNPTVTLGMDAFYGEQNIYGQAHQSLDMRIIQRDSLNHHCIQKSHYGSISIGDLYFPNNLDSKVDFRPEFFGIDENNDDFELFIHADHYPLTLTVIDNNVFNGYCFGVILLDSNCVFDEVKGICHAYTEDTLFTISQSHQNTLVVVLYIIVNTNKINSPAPLIKIFPNPASQHLFVEGLEDLEGAIVVSNSLGQIVLQQTVLRKNLQLNIAPLSRGIYFIHYYDKNRQLISSQQFVK